MIHRYDLGIAADFRRRGCGCARGCGRWVGMARGVCDSGGSRLMSRSCARRRLELLERYGERSSRRRAGGAKGRTSRRAVLARQPTRVKTKQWCAAHPPPRTTQRTARPLLRAARPRRSRETDGARRAPAERRWRAAPEDIRAERAGAVPHARPRLPATRSAAAARRWPSARGARSRRSGLPPVPRRFPAVSSRARGNSPPRPS